MKLVAAATETNPDLCDLSRQRSYIKAASWLHSAVRSRLSSSDQPSEHEQKDGELEGYCPFAHLQSASHRSMRKATAWHSPVTRKRVSSNAQALSHILPDRLCIRWVDRLDLESDQEWQNLCREQVQHYSTLADCRDRHTYTSQETMAPSSPRAGPSLLRSHNCGSKRSLLTLWMLKSK